MEIKKRKNYLFGTNFVLEMESDMSSSKFDFFEKSFLHFSGIQTEQQGNFVVLIYKKGLFGNENKNGLLGANLVFRMETDYFCLQNQKTLIIHC